MSRTRVKAYFRVRTGYLRGAFRRGFYATGTLGCCAQESQPRARLARRDPTRRGETYGSKALLVFDASVGGRDASMTSRSNTCNNIKDPSTIVHRHSSRSCVSLLACLLGGRGAGWSCYCTCVRRVRSTVAIVVAQCDQACGNSFCYHPCRIPAVDILHSRKETYCS